MALINNDVEPSYYRELARLPKEFGYQDLLTATENFNISNKLGSGASASVYKGFLNGGSVAVKKVERSEHGKLFFEAEVSTIASLQHINLVHLKGFCRHEIKSGGDSFIVYEFLPNGSLDSWIFPKTGRPSDHFLSWNVRYQVAIDVAKALIYLHYHCRPPIFHFDVKPANILLDGGFCAVLADFGLSVLTNKDGSKVYSKMSRGTPGYMAPEISVSEDHISAKCDIYSYDRVLLDLFFGLPYVCLNKDAEDIYEKDGNSFREKRAFHAFLQENLDKGDLVRLADKRLLGKVPVKEANTLVHVALCCLQKDPAKRPDDMQKVLQMLVAGRLVLEEDLQAHTEKVSSSIKALEDTPWHTLVVIVHGVYNLESYPEEKETTHLCAEVSYGSEKYRTGLVLKTRDPKWGEKFTFLLDGDVSKQAIKVSVHDRYRGTYGLAAAKIDLGRVVKRKFVKQWYKLTDKLGDGDPEIKIECLFHPGSDIMPHNWARVLFYF